MGLLDDLDRGQAKELGQVSTRPCARSRGGAAGCVKVREGAQGCARVCKGGQAAAGDWAASS